MFLCTRISFHLFQPNNSYQQIAEIKIHLHVMEELFAFKKMCFKTNVFIGDSD